jgi:hypothetical protein
MTHNPKPRAARPIRARPWCAMRDRMACLLKDRPPGDWAWMALLVSTGLFLLFSKRFWEVLPF